MPSGITISDRRIVIHQLVAFGPNVPASSSGSYYSSGCRTAFSIFLKRRRFQRRQRAFIGIHGGLGVVVPLVVPLAAVVVAGGGAAAKGISDIKESWSLPRTPGFFTQAVLRDLEVAQTPVHDLVVAYGGPDD